VNKSGPGGLLASLNHKLFDFPSLSSVHELPTTGVFRSRVLRWLWFLWTRRLSAGGRYFFLASGLFFGYGATSLELQAFVPLAYAVSVWLLALIMVFVEKPRVLLTVSHADKVSAGQALTVSFALAQQGVFPSNGFTVLPDDLPDSVKVNPVDGVPVVPLAKGQMANGSLTLLPQSRGVFRLGGFRVETDAPFGLINSSRSFDRQDQIIVYPNFTRLERLELPVGRRHQPGGMAFAAPTGESLEYIGNRDYREGDDIRHIDWRSTARLNRPIIREYREEYFLRAALVLDTYIPTHNAAQLRDLESAISLCAACCDSMNRSDYLVDILAEGTRVHLLAPGHGSASLDEMLEVLSCVEPVTVSPWAQLEPDFQQHLECVSSIICLFLGWDEDRRNFATNLAAGGAAVRIIVVTDQPLQLDPVRSWPSEVTVISEKRFAQGVHSL
jgi:uncharacterized protein (DUF58 family)